MRDRILHYKYAFKVLLFIARKCFKNNVGFLNEVFFVRIDMITDISGFCLVFLPI